MKALMKKSPEKGIWMEDIDEPKCGVSDVKIKISHTAICGTDLHIYSWDEWAQRNIKPPIVIGHEFVGTIVEIGSDVENYYIGQRVSGEGHITCNFCRNCRAGKKHLCVKTIGVGIHRDGAFAEYLVIPGQNVFPVHDEIPSEIAAFFDPFGNAVHTALSYNVLGEDVLITGAGPIGLMATAVCKLAGARNIVVTDICDYRLSLASIMGSTRSVNVNTKGLDVIFKELNISSGFDVGLEMSGRPEALNLMLKNMYHGGKVALLGILPNSTKINWDNVIFKGLNIKGIYGREMFETWYKMTQMLRSGLDISKVLTHKLHIDKYEEAFQVIEEGNCGKVVMEW